VITYSADGTCRSANDAAARLLDMPHEHLLKQNLRETSFWRASGLLDPAEETMRTVGACQYETLLPSDRGGGLWLEVGLSRIDLTGEATFLVSLVDISERKQAEEALRVREERYRTLFDSANDGIILHDLGGRILEANRLVGERLGRSSADLLGMNVADIRSPEAGAQYLEHMEEVRRRGRVVFETVRQRRDGSTVAVEVSPSGSRRRRRVSP
jgi:PAS domain S-box-containing protein